MSVGYLVHDFDLLNVAHLDLLAQAGKRCSTLVVGVLSDEAVESLDGRQAIVPLHERVALVARVRGVGRVVTHTTVPPEVTVVFAVAAQSPVVPDVAAVLLEPGRESSSPLLRAALRPVRSGDVLVETAV